MTLHYIHDLIFFINLRPNLAKHVKITKGTQLYDRNKFRASDNILITFDKKVHAFKKLQVCSSRFEKIWMDLQLAFKSIIIMV